MGALENRKLVYILGALLLLIAAALGFSLTRGSGDSEKEEAREETAAAEEPKQAGQQACASNATYARLKEVAFEEAAKMRTPDQVNLDTLASHSVVRMENPVVRSRDEDLNVTVCTGRFILELPPGAENAFDGKRRLDAEVEYAAQAAVDGSGLVYQMDGAEPIIYRLATFGMQGGPLPKIVAAAPAPDPAVPPAAEPTLMPPVAETAPRPAPPPPPPPVRTAERRPQAAPAPAPARAAAAPPAPAAGPATRVTVRPSFNCRHGKTRTEKMICASPRLAAQDRAMASLYYDLMAKADPATRGHLRRSRDAFLGRREQCRSESCVNSTYASRMAELRNIGRGD